MDARTAEILANTKAHGFEFVAENLAKNDVTLRGLPVIHVIDYVKFDTLAPGIVLDSINGTSTHVSAQRVARDYAYDNQRQDVTKRDETIRQKQVEWILGIKTTRTVEVQKFGGPKDEDGNRVFYDTEAEADAAWEEWQAAQ